MGREFQPNKGILLVRRKEENEQLKSGLFIPETAREKPQEGTVIATHPENVYKVGDSPLFGKYAGVDIKLDGMDGETLLLLPEAEVLGLLVEKKKGKHA